MLQEMADRFLIDPSNISVDANGNYILTVVQDASGADKSLNINEHGSNVESACANEIVQNVRQKCTLSQSGHLVWKKRPKQERSLFFCN